jgi:hypothetical protein
VDPVGNLLRPARATACGDRAVVIGSHLDSGAVGGIFDGAAGVAGGAWRAARQDAGAGFVPARDRDRVTGGAARGGGGAAGSR